MKIDKNTKILIIGLGLIGGSYAKALSKKGFFVGALDTDERAIDYALKNNIIENGTVSTNPEYIGQFDLIIFAVYPDAIIGWISQNQQFIKENAVITDVTGIKCSFIHKLQNMLRDDLEFIGAHPMAGRESSGIENSSAEIFNGANYIITPTQNNTQSAINVCHRLGVLLGFSNITVLTPEQHDEIIGFLSQLTHCIAVSLMTCRDMNGMSEYSGDSFRDLTRIAKINDEMWSELFLLNKDKLLCQMDLFKNSFDKLYNLISSGDRESIREIMKKSTLNRELFDKKKGNDLL
ncbi:MAG: prephenate dehydrogenase [Firmicutes bacterium]|nr:prephenate dehydrogenase [Bacillota bacterium]